MSRSLLARRFGPPIRAACTADVIVSAAPADRAASVRVGQPILREHYEFLEKPAGPLSAVLDGLVRPTRPEEG